MREPEIPQACTRHMRLVHDGMRSAIRAVCDLRTGHVIVPGVQVASLRGRLRLAFPAGVRLAGLAAEEAERVALDDYTRLVRETDRRETGKEARQGGRH